MNKIKCERGNERVENGTSWKSGCRQQLWNVYEGSTNLSHPHISEDCRIDAHKFWVNWLVNAPSVKSDFIANLKFLTLLYHICIKHAKFMSLVMLLIKTNYLRIKQYFLFYFLLLDSFIFQSTDWSIINKVSLFFFQLYLVYEKKILYFG